MHRLRAPGGCPWDPEQTHESLVPNLIEEAYECAEALQSADAGHQCEELGDLLLQVIMHAEIGNETGAYDLDKVADGISEKLIRQIECQKSIFRNPFFAQHGSFRYCIVR